jgi:hypothetical protein
MKVYEKYMEGVPHYYLSESRFFKSIMELITCYEHASLSENFVGYVGIHSAVLLLCLVKFGSDLSGHLHTNNCHWTWDLLPLQHIFGDP